MSRMSKYSIMMVEGARVLTLGGKIQRWIGADPGMSSGYPVTIAKTDSHCTVKPCVTGLARCECGSEMAKMEEHSRSC